MKCKQIEQITLCLLKKKKIFFLTFTPCNAQYDSQVTVQKPSIYVILKFCIGRFISESLFVIRDIKQEKTRK